MGDVEEEGEEEQKPRERGGEQEACGRGGEVVDELVVVDEVSGLEEGGGPLCVEDAQAVPDREQRDARLGRDSIGHSLLERR